MTTVDLTVELLKQIRDGVHEANARIAETNGRLDRTRTEFMEGLGELRGELQQTNTRLEKLDGRVEKLDGRVGRLEGQLSEGLGYIRLLAERDDKFATEMADIRRRVEALEASTDRTSP
jgi:chromosome segregation ATPase